METHQLDLPGVTLRAGSRQLCRRARSPCSALRTAGSQIRGRHRDEIGQTTSENENGARPKRRPQVRDALGRRVRVLHEVSDVPGYTVHLTLDRQLQQTAYEALTGKEGTIVAIDVHSGAILALASTPAFDPNSFARGIKSDEWRALIQDRLRPLNNRATQGQFPPGSTFKIVMAIAGLEEGVINPDAYISDPGFFTFGNRSFRDWKQGGHGSVNLHHAIVISCDTYFYQLGPKLGVDRIAKAKAFGLGEKSGVALDDERGGTIPDTAWKMKRFRQPWYPGETVSVAIGQGYVTVTPLQMANMMATVANGGKLFRPRIVSKVESVDGTSVREYGPELIRTIEIKPDTLTRVRSALADVVKGGTGGMARSPIVDIAGKTGTAQVVEMKGGYVKSEQLSYFNRDHAWFVAYAPVQDPQIAIAVLIEHGGHGGDAAAPMAKKVFEKFVEQEKQKTEKQQVHLDGETRAD